MAKTRNSNYCIINLDQIDQILRIDGVPVTPSNKYNAYVCMNCWLHSINDFSTELMGYFKHCLLTQGLVATVKDSSLLADTLVDIIDQGSCNPAKDVYSSLWYQQLASRMFAGLCQQIIDTLIGKITSTTASYDLTGLKVGLFLLRFPKRFTYASNPTLLSDSLRSILSMNRKAQSQYMRVHSSTYYELCDMVKTEMAAMIEGLADLNGEDDAWFSSGSSYEHAKTLLDKMRVFAKSSATLKGYPLPSGSNGYLAFKCRLVGVPKSYKAYRVIAPEEVSRVYHGEHLQSRVRIAYTANRVPITCHDQSISQRACEDAAATGEMCTIDMSSASDSISLGLALDVTPKILLDAILPTRPDHVEYYTKRSGKPKCTPLYIWLTSGHPMTWDYESLLFLSIARVAAKLRRDTGGRLHHDAIVYGDDLIVDSLVYDTVIELLEYLGFTVNTEKSFSGNYRESCGAEYTMCQYERSFDLRTAYFPRSIMFEASADDVLRDLDAKNIRREVKHGALTTSIAALCALQHNLWDAHRSLYGLTGYDDEPSACVFITDVVKRFFPEMTFSHPGSVSDDLWAIAPRISLKQLDATLKAPAWGIREQHYVVSSRHARGQLRDLSNDDLVYLDTYRYVEFLQYGVAECDDPAYRWIDGKRISNTEPRRNLSNDAFGAEAVWVLKTQ